MIPGEVLFKLYDTFGFPLDLVADMARDMHFEIDEEGYRKAMQEQRDKARAAWAGSGEEKVKPVYREVASGIKKTVFTGFGALEGTGEVVAIIRDDKKVNEVKEGDEAEIILDQTTFYAESGGQVGDRGELLGEAAKFSVTDTVKPVEGVFVHKGKVKKGGFKVGDAVLAKVDATERMDTMRHHTATHILHATLRSVLGEHVKQAGSLVAPDRCRFDFTHYTALSEREKERIEELVNERIIENHPVSVVEMGIDQAIAAGAMALFDEKYGDKVRVVTVRDVSKELCGGTHAQASGDIGLFKIVSEGGIAAGVRRLEILAGRRAYQAVRKEEQSLKEIAQLMKASDPDVVGRVEKLMGQLRDTEKELERLKHKMQSSQAGIIIEGAKVINGVRVLARRVENMDPKDLRDFGDKLRDNMKSGILGLGLAKDDKVSLIVMVSKDLTSKYHAGNLIKEMAAILGGTGGGKPDLAQAGGKDPSKLDAALEALYGAVEKSA
jgi:alanyl-tRNA synthetase